MTAVERFCYIYCRAQQRRATRVTRVTSATKASTEMAKRLGQHQAPSSAWIRPERRLALYIRDEFRCLYCDRSLKNSDAQDLTLDHLVSKAEFAKLDAHTRAVFGSVNASHNLVLACRSCNSARRDTPWERFADDNARARILARTLEPVNVALAKAIISGDTGDPRLEIEAA